jgi:hypothetical protein
MKGVAFLIREFRSFPPPVTFEPGIFYFYHKTADKKRRGRFCRKKDSPFHSFAGRW